MNGTDDAAFTAGTRCNARGSYGTPLHRRIAMVKLLSVVVFIYVIIRDSGIELYVRDAIMKIWRRS